MARKGLYYNINKRKKAGTSRSKSKSTISDKAYANMKAGFPKRAGGMRSYLAGGLQAPPMYGPNVIPGQQETAATVYQQSSDELLDDYARQLIETQQDTSYIDDAQARLQQQQQNIAAGEQAVVKSGEKLVDTLETRNAMLEEAGQLTPGQIATSISKYDPSLIKTGKNLYDMPGLDAAPRGTVAVADASGQPLMSLKPGTTLQDIQAQAAADTFAGTAVQDATVTGVSGGNVLQTGASKAAAAAEGASGSAGIAGSTAAGISSTMGAVAPYAKVIGEVTKYVADDDDPTTWNVGEATGGILSSAATGASVGGTIGAAIGGPLAPISGLIGGIAGGLYGVGKGLVERGSALKAEDRAQAKQKAAESRIGARMRQEAMKSRMYSGYDFGTDMAKMGGERKTSSKRLLKISKELAKASKMHKGQSERVEKIANKYQNAGFKDRAYNKIAGLVHIRNQRIEDIAKSIPGLSDAFKNMSLEDRGNLLNTINRTEYNVNQTVKENQKEGTNFGFWDAVRIARGAKVSNLRPLRKQMGMSKAEFARAIKDAVVSNIQTTNKNVDPDTVSEEADKYYAMAKLPLMGLDYRQGGLKTFGTGGVKLPGGMMKPIPGSDAVEFKGASHEKGGILLDPQTEVEGGETMDKVNMKKQGGKRDYFFSQHLKLGGKSFAQRHKDILRKGGNQKDINLLAKMQERAAGRNPDAVEMRAGGPRKFQLAGFNPGVNPYDTESDPYGPDNPNSALNSVNAYGGLIRRTRTSGMESFILPDGTVTMPGSVEHMQASAFYNIQAPIRTQYKESEYFESRDQEGFLTGKASQEQDKTPPTNNNQSNTGGGSGSAGPSTRGEDMLKLETIPASELTLLNRNTDGSYDYDGDPNTLNDRDDKILMERSTVPKEDGTISTNETTKGADGLTRAEKKALDRLYKDVPNLAIAAGVAQLGPAMYAMLHKEKAQKLMGAPGRIKAPNLDRVSYNAERMANAADNRALNRFIETSGGGPANIISKMAAYRRKQTGDMQIAAAEAKANTQIANAEAQMGMQADIQNVRNRMQVDSINTQLKEQQRIAEENQKMMGLDRLASGAAGLAGDVMSYQAEQALARSAGTFGVYERNRIRQMLLGKINERTGKPYTNEDIAKIFGIKINEPVPTGNTETEETE